MYLQSSVHRLASKNSSLLFSLQEFSFAPMHAKTLNFSALAPILLHSYLLRLFFSLLPVAAHSDSSCFLFVAALISTFLVQFHTFLRELASRHLH